VSLGFERVLLWMCCSPPLQKSSQWTAILLNESAGGANINVFWRRAVQDEVACLGWIPVVSQLADSPNAAVYQQKNEPTDC